MDELVNNVIVAGGGAAVFVAILTQLLKPALAKVSDDWRDLATNATALALGELAAFGLSFAATGITDWQHAAQVAFIGLAAAGTATFGYEGVKNFRERGNA